MFAHVDADAFFASVLVRKDPRLKGRPVLALGMGGSCVIAATYEAKAKGVKTGMRLTDALKLVPDAIRLPSDFRETAIASRQIESILQECCSKCEQMSIDEWFLDLDALIGGHPADPYIWGKDIQATVLRRTTISVSVGIAPSKLLAKMAGEYQKPAGVTLVNTETTDSSPFSVLNSQFLKDRPAAAIPGIGAKRQEQARINRWQSAWDIAVADPDIIRKLFGRPGLEMQRELMGEAVNPVKETADPQKSISRCRSFRATADFALVYGHLLKHLEYTVLKMRRSRLACSGLCLWLRDGEYSGQSEKFRLPRAMDTEHEIRPYVQRCFSRAKSSMRACTQAGLALLDLKPGGIKQYSLFENPLTVERDEKMQSTLDDLHARFGRDAIGPGSAMQVKSGTKRMIGLPFAETTDNQPHPPTIQT